MRRPRFKGLPTSQRSYFHCVSRIVGREFLLGSEEKEQFLRLMRTYEKLYHVRVLSHCVMSNHFHILVEIPKRPAESALPNDEELVAHIRSCLGDQAATSLLWELSHYRKQGNESAAEDLRESWFSRMWDVSRFMKILKQRFTQWYNRRHERRGTLWEARFRSVLVEGKGRALQTIAAYIELNPVRANLCADPKDYRWSSYGEAVAGHRIAKDALRWLNSIETDGQGGLVETSPTEGAHQARAETLISMAEALRMWRCFLFGVPYEAGLRDEELAREASGGEAQLYRDKVSREKALEILGSGGRLKLSEYLRCRVRYLTDGAALGSKLFVEAVFDAEKENFSKGRVSGARSLRGLATIPKPKRLYNLRELQKNVIS